ncbi:MAG: hypothetical protein J6U54_02030 [Clostridiales bacterium]|nr:hypothetical protein [Clostridiales bacterium]
MDNNNYNNQQYQPQQQYQQYTDPNYEAQASAFLKKTITALILAAFPIANIFGVVMASGNIKAILAYLQAGGMHTSKIKTCSALSKAAKYYGIASIIMYAFLCIYYVFIIFAVIGTAMASYR